MKILIAFSLILLFNINVNASTKKDTIPDSYIISVNNYIKEIRTNPNSSKGLDYLYFLRIDLPLDTLEELYALINPKLKKTKKGIEVSNDIEWRHKIRHLFNIYILVDTNGKTVVLSDLIKRQKYTLIDFWSSWCIPCRNDSPNLIELNNKYSNSNFGIISISEDVNTKDWLDGIRTDKTNKWTHLIDSKRDIQNDLGIETIPRKLLVNDKLEVVGVYTSNFYGKYNLANDLKKYKIN